MKNNRPKIGQPTIDWKEFAFGAGKNRRKTVGFGKYDKREREYEDEIYIRELSIVDGGIGCALWDAAIILTRWIYDCPKSIFHQQLVLELGAGVGLPGICAARYTKQCFLTDYLIPVVENLQYNIDVNAGSVTNSNFFANGNNGGDDDDNGGDEFLMMNAGDGASGENAEKQSNSDDDDDKEEQEQEQEQEMDQKEKWKLNVRRSARAVLLNWDHIGNDDLMILDDPGVIDIPKKGIDLIIGSELTYTGSESTINNLIRVIDHFLKPFGVFVEILSDDRDGVSQFLEDVKNNGYNYAIIPCHERYLGNYGTNQRPETYKFYVFVRENEMEDNALFTAICESMK